jgi:hypothetical protein
MTEQADKTRKLQAQFICPIWTVWFGKSVNLYFTRYHAEQMVRALEGNQTPCAAYNGKGEAI